MFEELKERLEAAADAAHEEYCDAVKVGRHAASQGGETLNVGGALDLTFTFTFYYLLFLKER